MKPILQNIQVLFFLCLSLGITQQGIAQCGYDISLNADNLTVQGSIFNDIADGPDYPQNLEWYLPANNQVIGYNTDFEFSAITYGECSICVDYKVNLSDGSDCSEIICKTVTLTNSAVSCEADFGVEQYAGPIQQVGGLTFNNTSSGDFTNVEWNFGDGTVNTESVGNISHFYIESGTYDVSLKIWDGGNCYAEHSQTVEVTVPDNPCDELDCVWPGDTDSDGKATLQDMINIGVGFGMQGPSRVDVSNDWTAHPAQDWAQENEEGINYKHFDCNGDGEIGITDIPAIQNNYVKLENGVSITEEDAGVPISLSFDIDTFVITEENQYLEINAGLNFGNSNHAMEDIYGVVLYLTYQRSYVSTAEPIRFDYNDNSFFGDMGSVIPLARNIEEHGQTDIVLTRRVENNISGQGRVASLKFIIEGDIIDGRAEKEGEHFFVKINMVSAVDKSGNEVAFSLPTEPASVFFQNGIISTAAKDDLIADDQLSVFPNPVNDLLRVNVDGDLHPEYLEIYNTLGQRMIYSDMNQYEQNVDVSRLTQGVYVLKVKTEEGVGTKRIIVEK